ncbi:stage II sporulation protein M [Paenibacillus sp. IB182496]|uniref:Stage II sporulation protein M n=1 Tax=Paenibacillus sabuli TaxID=2772509 RepID=A0A927BSE9_9BACL|nr:stage II sporulation protein M [Paenibacillus sabuli]MBD2844684.1 stage II sporulation protein M [Paenibacillus sabuli]
MFSYRAIVAHLKAMKGYFAFATILFFAGMVVGGTNVQLESFMNSQIEGLRQLVDTAESSSNPGLAMFGIIFLNNAVKSVVIMYLGVLFAVVPIFFMLVNGMVLGYLFTHMQPQQGTLFELIAKGILPHGIIEIPALVVACAYGIRFGILSFKGIGALFGKSPDLGKQYEAFVIRTVPIMVILVVSLLLAAVIESTVTVWLVNTIN